MVFIFTIENKIILYIMSITVSTSEQICHSPTNKSRSKMLFSFSKSSRFAHQKENKGHKFYDLTGCMRKRSTCFGYGNKYDFTKEYQMPITPAPGTYEKQTLFDISKKKNKGFCFGSGREQMQVTGLTPKNKNPGPGTYQSFSQRGKISYSLRAKFKVDNREKIYVPGPGKYETYSTFNLSKRNFLAKHINKSACRFQIAEKLKTEDLKIPGPGAYDTSKTDLSPEGRYCLSKLRTVKSRRFGTSLRSTFQNRCQTPGPGNYKIPSEFGHYLSKKYSAEAKT